MWREKKERKKERKKGKKEERNEEREKERKKEREKGRKEDGICREDEEYKSGGMEGRRGMKVKC